MGDLVVDGRIEACECVDRIHEAHIIVQAAEPCGHPNETVVCLKGGEFRVKLSESNL